MFVIFGHSGHRETVADTEKKVCPYCGNERQFFLTHRYTAHHIFFLPIFSAGHVFHNACSNCGRGDELSMAEAEAMIGRAPVSWFSRFGWSIPFIVVGGWWVILTVVFQLAKLFR